MSVYVLNSDGSISSSISNQSEKRRKDLNVFLKDSESNLTFDDANKKSVTDSNPVVNVSVPNQQGYIVAVETLGDFKSGKNYASNSHSVFDAEDLVTLSPTPLSSEGIIPDGVISSSTALYPYAFGTNMDAVNPKVESLPFYRSYNTFFDLDQKYSGRTGDIEKNLEIFADEAEMLYGIPALLNQGDEPEKLLNNLTNVFTSLIDMLIGAIVPIAAVSLIQTLLQAAQSGPRDPFGIMPDMSSFFGNSDKYGKFIQYIKFDISKVGPALQVLANLGNAVIEGLVSLLRTTERLMNFPANLMRPGLSGLFNIVENTIAFCIGYIFYLIPGFKLDERIKNTSNPADIIGSLFSAIASLVSASKCRHHYNLLIRKIVKNNYFRRQIQFKAKTITNLDGSEYGYSEQYFYQLSDFFHRFVGERIAVGLRTLGIINSRDYNKNNNLFSIQRMSELPVTLEDNGAQIPAPIPLGSSVLGGSQSNQSESISARNFNKSIYSLNSLVTKSNDANTFLKYHNELVKQNEAIYQKKERRLSREHVKKLEAIINSDYMPFSIQDLRTNELFKFHAFTENVSDSFTVSWEDAGMGFGRMDSIKTYKGTNRRITVDFWLISMSADDFDYMWWMVNRLIALIYPQWSAPKPANIENQKKAGAFEKGSPLQLNFSQPFTQIPTGSPLIRLRLGDLFTSNYSKKSLSKIFGFDLQDFTRDTNITTSVNNIKEKTNTIPNTYQGNYKNLSLIGYQTFTHEQYKDHVDNKNWFFKLDQVDFESPDDKKFIINFKKYEERLGDIKRLFNDYSQFYYNPSETVNLDDINSPNNFSNVITNNDSTFKTETNNLFDYKKLVYVPIEIIEDNSEQILILLYEITVKKVEENQKDDDIKSSIPLLLSNAITSAFVEIYSASANENNINIKEQIKENLNIQSFMSSKGVQQISEINPTKLEPRQITNATNPGEIVNNPIVKSFESTMGEGLAGTIQGFSINFDQNIPWELTEGSRAPMAVKIGLQMDVIHDILPGLDDKGIMRAPTYRVGNLNNTFFGKSVYDELPNNVSTIPTFAPPSNK